MEIMKPTLLEHDRYNDIMSLEAFQIYVKVIYISIIHIVYKICIKL